MIADVLKIQAAVWDVTAWLEPRLTAAGSAKFGDQVIYRAYRAASRRIGLMNFHRTAASRKSRGSVISEAGQESTTMFRRRALRLGGGVTATLRRRSTDEPPILNERASCTFAYLSHEEGRPAMSRGE